MNGTLLIVGIAGVIGFWFLKRAAFVAEDVARKLLAEGALVLDVRSPEEFQRGKVPGAVNVPLGDLASRIARLAPDKQKPILVHCLSGGRSAIAQSQLRRLGYAQVFNLGSLRRAQQLYAAQKSETVRPR